jgi:hypothetical protein
MRKTHLLAVLLLSLFAAWRTSHTALASPRPPAPIESFEFSFTVPTFVTEGQSPAFTPFVVTDGTNQWGMWQDIVGYAFDPAYADLQVPCFEFGDHVPDLAGCGVAGLDYPDSAAILFYLPHSSDPACVLPTANGVYALGIESDFVTLAGTDEFANGNGQLTISSEPSPVVLLLTTLLAVAFVARKRIARGRAWVLPHRGHLHLRLQSTSRSRWIFGRRLF